jgi:transposase-like protein
MQSREAIMHPPETRQAVIARLMEGDSLRKAAKACGVDPSTVLGWVDSDPAYSQQYAQARARGYQLLADEILEISDDSSQDVIETEHGPKVNAEVVARSRLRVDSRKWMLAKMLPKVYGEKIEQTHEFGESVTKVVREIVRG